MGNSHIIVFGDVMDYTKRLTKRIKCDDSYAYTSDASFVELFTRLGQYEDFSLTPQEMASVLIDYEMAKPKEKWNMDNLEKWAIIKNTTLE